MRTKEDIKGMMSIPAELYDKVEFFLQDVITRPEVKKEFILKKVNSFLEQEGNTRLNKAAVLSALSWWECNNGEAEYTRKSTFGYWRWYAARLFSGKVDKCVISIENFDTYDDGSEMHFNFDFEIEM